VSVILEVVVIHEDQDQMGAPYEEVSPVFQTSDDGQKFSVIDIIISFSGIEGLGVVPYWALSSGLFMCLV